MKKYSLWIVAPVFVLVIYNIAYYFFVLEVIFPKRWIEEPSLKVHLADPSDEVVFIGSSRTQNQLNSAALEGGLGVKVFNYGVVGRRWQNYPYMIDRLFKFSSPKYLVIALPAKALKREVPCSQLPVSIAEFRFYARHKRYICLFNNGLDEYLGALPMNRYDDYLKLNRIPNYFFSLLKSRYSYDPEKDVRGMTFIRGDAKRLVVTYPNGDGQVFSGQASYSGDSSARKVVEFKIDDIERHAKKYLLQLISMINERGASAIIIMEPVGNEYRDEFTPQAQAEFSRIIGPQNHALFLDGAVIDRTMWADRGHLNIEGTNVYTELVMEELKAILKVNDVKR